jgi:outer membrane protein assembly factor BamB
MIAVTPTGKERWKSPLAAHVLLGPTPDAPVVLVDSVDARDANPAARSVTLLDAASGRVDRAFVLRLPRTPWETWIRDDSTLFTIEAAASDAASSLVAIDVAAGRVAWTRETGVAIRVSTWSVDPAIPLFTPTSVHLFCGPPGARGPDARDLCRFSRTTGELTKTFPGPIEDASRSRAAKQIFLLGPRDVTAFTDDGELLWARPLPEGFFGQRVLAGDAWIAVLSSRVEHKDRHQERLTALAIDDGHELWSKETLPGGEHFSADLAMGGDRVLVVAKLARSSARRS